MKFKILLLTLIAFNISAMELPKKKQKTIPSSFNSEKTDNFTPSTDFQESDIIEEEILESGSIYPVKIDDSDMLELEELESGSISSDKNDVEILKFIDSELAKFGVITEKNRKTKAEVIEEIIENAKKNSFCLYNEDEILLNKFFLLTEIDQENLKLLYYLSYSINSAFVNNVILKLSKLSKENLMHFFELIKVYKEQNSERLKVSVQLKIKKFCKSIQPN